MAPLTDHEKAVYEWQIWVPGFGEAGQQALKDASVLVSRVGGLGSVVAYELAAAGIGRLVLAHAGDIKPSDLNRQLLMTHDGLGSSRVESAQRRLKELNPRLEIVAVPENVTEENAAKLVGEVDLVVDCAPLFPERFAMNRQCIQQDKPLVDCAMYDWSDTLPGVPVSRRPPGMASRISGFRSGLGNGGLSRSHGSHQGIGRRGGTVGRYTVDL